MKKKQEFDRVLCMVRKGFLIMKLFLLIMVLGVLQSTASVYSQTKRFSLNERGISIKEVLENIEHQSEFRFFYDEGLTNINDKLDIDVEKTSIEEVLMQIFKQTGIEYKIMDNNFIVLKASQEGISQQQKIVEGKVTDSSGQPLPGVTVILKGTTHGIITDVDGNYSLPNVPSESTLVFSFVGMKTQEITVAGRNSIDVIMKEDAIGLEEVVAIGYGSQKKRDLTGSVASIREESIKDVSVTSIDQTIQGLAPGVVVQQQSGQPGGATSIRIRGGNSINAGNEPLYVIDGFPIYNENSSASSGILSGVPTENALLTINPSDIVSIEILKDASSTAIYGSRAANGVIMITTRRGKEGASKVDFEAYYGIQEAAKTYDLLDAYEYGMFRNDEYKRQQNPVTYTDEQLAEFKRTGGTNWQDEMLRVAPVQNYQLSVSGGSEKMQYALSGNYYNQDGIMINSNLNRFSLRSNVDVQANKWMKFGESLTISHSRSNQIPTGGGISGQEGIQSSGSVWAAALFMNPAIPVYDENGEYTFDNTYPLGKAVGANNSNVPFGNPVAYANLVDSENSVSRILGSIYGEFQILDGLKLKVTGGTNILYNKQNMFQPSTVRLGQRAPNGSASIGTAQNIEFLNENTLTYDVDVSDTDHLTLLVGGTYQTFERQGFYGGNVEFATDDLSYNNIQGGNLSGSYYPSIASDKDEWTLMSGLFRGFYSMNDKYLFTITGRYDGSSKFGANNKWAFFPSAAFGWRISEEEFMNDSNIDNLKLRLSWGKSGNQNIPTYRSLSSLGTSSYFIGGNLQTGFGPSRVGNPDLKWETTTQTDIGFDLGLFDSRLNITADAYYKKTADLLFNVPIPFESGFTDAFKNIGSLENKGIELSVQAVILNGDFKWNLNANWALNRNKIMELQGEERILIDPNLNLLKAQNSLILEVGEPIGNFYGYENIGIWQSQAEIDASNMKTAWSPGERRFKDQNNDGLINDDDRVIIGNALPSFTGGFSNSFSYKNLDLNFLIDYSVGNDVANLTQIEFEFLNGRQNGNKEVLKRWQPDDINLDRNFWTNSTNPDTDVQAVGYNANTRQLHSRYVEDGSFVKLRNVTLGYTLPLTKLGLTFLKNVRAYFSARNLLTITKYSGLDPEASIFQNDNVRLGFDYAVYPTMKSYTFGINIGL